MSDWITPNSDAVDIKKDERNSNGDYPVYIGRYEDSISFPSSFDAAKLSYIYKFTEADGTPYALYGFTTLNRFMEGIPKGAMVKINYNGMGKNKKQQDLHLCNVQYKMGEDLAGTVDTSADDLPF